MTIEEINQMIADRSGIPLSTVQKVFAGATASPRRETIEALESVLEKDKNVVYGDPVTSDCMVCETSAAYNAHAEDGNSNETGNRLYTLEDYLRLPDDQRVELIDGVFYDMAAPTTIHQSIAGFLHKKLLDFVMENKGPCFPYLVIEVLSPSTRRKDMQLKMYKYAGAGVREYWMVDPEKKLIVQYDLEHLEIPAIYNFQSVIPVLIWGGACRIDLGEMDETIGFLWEL